MNDSEDRFRAEPAKHILERAESLDRDGREEEAVRLYESALAGTLDEKDRSGALLGYGSTLRNLGRLSEAEAALREGLRRYPTYRAYVPFLALTLQSAGRGDEAVALLVNELLAHSTDANVKAHQRALHGYIANMFGKSEDAPTPLGSLQRNNAEKVNAPARLRDLVMAFYDARRRGDLVAVRAMMHANVSWTDPTVGDHMGPLNGVDQVIDMLTRAQAAVDGTFSQEVGDSIETANLCACVVRWTAQKRGLVIDGCEVALFAFKDGRIASVTFNTDNIAHDVAFWT